MKPQKIDFTSQAFKRDPYPTLLKLVRDGPLIPVKLPVIGRFWLVTTHDAVSQMLRDRETFVRDPKTLGKKRGSNLPWWLPRFIRPLAEGMINRDEPEHRRLRGLVEQAFLRRNIEQMSPQIEAIAEQFIDDMDHKAKHRQEVPDLIKDFARPFPLTVICELLGLPQKDRDQFTQMASRLGVKPSLLKMAQLLPAIKRLQVYITQQVRQCREHPREGLISALVAADQDGDRLTEEESVAMVYLLLLAGHITTVHLIGCGVLALLENPDQKQSLLSDWSKLDSAVDEMLRYGSPVQMTKPMMASRDMVWQGEEIKRGERFLANLAAANCDPSKFDQPQRFDIGRRPNPHVAFGAGIHICLGLKLARAETEIALKRLFTRFPNLGLTIDGANVEWTRQYGLRGPESLPIHFGATTQDQTTPDPVAVDASHTA